MHGKDLDRGGLEENAFWHLPSRYYQVIIPMNRKAKPPALSNRFQPPAQVRTGPFAFLRSLGGDNRLSINWVRLDYPVGVWYHSVNPPYE